MSERDAPKFHLITPNGPPWPDLVDDPLVARQLEWATDRMIEAFEAARSVVYLVPGVYTLPRPIRIHKGVTFKPGLTDAAGVTTWDND